MEIKTIENSHSTETFPITVHNYVAPLFCSYLEILFIFLSQHSSFCKMHHFTLLMDQMFRIVLETFGTMHMCILEINPKVV